MAKCMTLSLGSYVILKSIKKNTIKLQVLKEIQVVRKEDLSHVGSAYEPSS